MVAERPERVHVESQSAKLFQENILGIWNIRPDVQE